MNWLRKIWNRLAPVGWQDASGFHFGVRLALIVGSGVTLVLGGCAATPATPPLPIPPVESGVTLVGHVGNDLIAPEAPSPATLTLTWTNSGLSSNEVTVLVACTNLLNPQWQPIWEGYAVSNGSVTLTLTNPCEWITAKNQTGL